MQGKKTILVVEDNADMQMLYRDILEEQYNVLVAGDTADAMKRLNKGGVDMMILDIVLPKKRGDEFFYEIKRMPKFSDLKVLCITVIDDIRKKMKEMDGGTKFLAKPFEKGDLLKTVGQMLAS